MVLTRYMHVWASLSTTQHNTMQCNRPEYDTPIANACEEVRNKCDITRAGIVSSRPSDASAAILACSLQHCTSLCLRTCIIIGMCVDIAHKSIFFQPKKEAIACIPEQSDACMLHESRVSSSACPVVCASSLRAGLCRFPALEARQRLWSYAQMQRQAVCTSRCMYIKCIYIYILYTCFFYIYL